MIRSEDEYQGALDQINVIPDAPQDRDTELNRLVLEVEQYEEREYPEFRPAGRPGLFLLSGPSGAGKDSVLSKIREMDPTIHIAVTATTRRPREGELHGREYLFLETENFQLMDRNQEFLETATVHGHRYGTPREQVETPLSQGRNVLLKIDVQGAATVRQRMPEATGIFIMPESTAQLRKRLEARGMDPLDLETRLDDAHLEIIRGYREFHRIIMNREGRLDETVTEVMRAITEAPRRRK